jgi:hypothetical protein
MITKEYLTVNDVSKHYSTTARNVRRIISTISDDSNGLLLAKDKTDKWLIHRLLLPKFEPKRVRKSKFYALTIRPSSHFSTKEIDEMMRFVFKRFDDDDLEINYTLEGNNKGYYHIHCYIQTKRKRELVREIKEIFYQIDYKQHSIYDLAGWMKYITKDGSPIIKLNK